MENKISFQKYLKSIQIIFFALLIGQIFFGIVAIFVVNTEEIKYGHLNFQGIFNFIIPAIIVTSIVLSHIVFQKRLTAIKENQYIDQKLSNYRVSLIIRWALLEGPTFFTIIIFLLTGDYFVLGMAGFIIAFFIYIIPTQQRIEADLDLNWQEKSELGE